MTQHFISTVRPTALGRALAIGWMILAVATLAPPDIEEAHAAAGAAPGYRETVVENGGRIIGTARLEGAVPSPKAYLLSLSPFGTFCKKIADERGTVFLEEFTIGPENALQDVIVAVEGVGQGKPFPRIRAEFFATDCMFHPASISPRELYEVDSQGHAQHIHPLVTVIENPQPIKVSNQDPIFHNGQVFQRERGNIILNFPLPTSGEPQGGILQFDPGLRIGQMICGMHEFMQTWTFVVDNPYYDKTERDGAYAVEDLMPGTYTVIAWHPRFKPIRKVIEVPPNGTVSLDFSFDASEIKRRVYESEEGIRAFH